ncbi:toxin-antitoxin system YwqK family antitoxin [Campylobacter troglodytis]|uniref:toxin-antitoxin system YwqK family antitoxin n=1 Tax=Campylobacter troglodytis TaxID=654363 RepID=UPI00115BF7D8|nr:hypothetical protein [Campylobacter troglodytis]TQR57711.1 hypothetical protein DMC01_08375 [Campylobacter troglodytis]
MIYVLLAITLVGLIFIVSGEEQQPKGVVRIKKKYHGNDMIKEEIPYNLDNQVHGIYRYWHDNGNIQLKAIFKNGYLNGLCQKYDKRGRLIKKITYKDGVKIKEKTIDR